jgi:hypothetical protein
MIYKFIIGNAINYMPLKYHEIKLIYTSVFNGVNDLYIKRDKLCSKYASELIPLIVGRLYVQRFFNESDKQKVIYRISYSKNFAIIFQV